MQTAFHSRDRAGKLDAEATEVLVPPASPAPPPLSYLGAFRPQREQRAAPCILMLLYIVKGFGVLGWLVRGGDGLDPEGGASFEFG